MNFGKGFKITGKAMKLVLFLFLINLLFSLLLAIPMYNSLKDSLGQSEAGSRMAEVLRDIDVLVIPSRWCENSPLVLLDALATHTPVIVSDTPGLTEFVEEDRNGYRFTLGSAGHLEKVMRKFIDDPQLATKLSQSTEYPRTTRDMAEDVLKVYSFALGD